MGRRLVRTKPPKFIPSSRRKRRRVSSGSARRMAASLLHWPAHQIQRRSGLHDGLGSLSHDLTSNSEFPSRKAAARPAPPTPTSIPPVACKLRDLRQRLVCIELHIHAPSLCQTQAATQARPLPKMRLRPASRIRLRLPGVRLESNERSPQWREHSMKRWVIRISICFVLGLITTVCTSIAFACWSPILRTQDTFNFQGRLLELYDVPGNWKLVSGFASFYGRGYELTNLLTGALVGTGLGSPKFPEGTQLPPLWVQRQVRNPPLEYYRGTIISVARAGWPMKSLAGHTRRTVDLIKPPLPLQRFNAFELKEAVRIPWTGQMVPRLLPWKPLPLAFAINSVFYGSVWFALSFPAQLPYLWNQRRKRRRGLCPKCAYDLQAEFDSGCSECGWNRNALN